MSIIDGIFFPPAVKLWLRSISVPGLYRTPRQHQQSALRLGSLTNYTTLRGFATEPRHQRTETAGRPSNTRTKRPKAVSGEIFQLSADGAVHVRVQSWFFFTETVADKTFSFIFWSMLLYNLRFCKCSFPKSCIIPLYWWGSYHINESSRVVIRICLQFKVRLVKSATNKEWTISDLNGAIILQNEHHAVLKMTQEQATKTIGSKQDLNR